MPALFVPAPEVWAWAERVFCDPRSGSPAHNPDHAHLAGADVGALWTNAAHRRHGRVALGMVELPGPDRGTWADARARAQLVRWFGRVPAVLLTLSAPDFADVDTRVRTPDGDAYQPDHADARFAAVLEHECYHLVHRLTPQGEPMYDRETGAPVLALRGHDVEEFVGVVRRYGARATGTRALVEAAAQWEREPVFPAGALAAACGTCAR